MFYQIDQNFREVYRFLGGEAYMGPAITEPFTQNEVDYQYFNAGLLYWDWKREDSRYWHLAPLGLKLGVEEPPVTPPGDPNAVYIDGHIVHPMFVARFQQLGGEVVVGRPLTEARYDENGNLYQFFANLGFVAASGEGPNGVRYLPYGVWACDETCRSQPQQSAIPHPKDVFPEPAQSIQLPSRLSMETWQKYDQITSTETQEIGVTVYSEGVPLSGAEMILYLTLPDGSVPAYPMPPTGPEGQTSMTIEPREMQSGYLIPYEVCLTHMNQERLCVRESYLVWDSP